MYFTRNTKSNYRENDKFFAKRFTLLLKIESFYPQKIRQNTNTGKSNVLIRFLRNFVEKIILSINILKCFTKSFSYNC